jgi:hypothetical protein
MRDGTELNGARGTLGLEISKLTLKSWALNVFTAQGEGNGGRRGKKWMHGSAQALVATCLVLAPDFFYFAQSILYVYSGPLREIGGDTEELGN